MAARIATNSSIDAAIKPMFESLGWKTIQQLINTQSKIVTFKDNTQKYTVSEESCPKIPL